MQRGPKSGVSPLLWWSVLICVIAILGWPLLRVAGVILFRVMLPAALLFGGVWLAAQGGLFRGWGRRDEWSDEEAASRKRLADLEDRTDKVRLTLRELRALNYAAGDAPRAEWAQVDLDDSLRDLRRAMGRERAVLFSLDAARWMNRLEPLLQELDLLHAPDTRQWLRRLYDVRDQGLDILVRLRADRDARELSLGASTGGLIEEALGEIDCLLASLMQRRAVWVHQEAVAAEATADPDATLAQLKDALSRVRTRRQVRLRRKH
jgi:hypothetical protein